LLGGLEEEDSHTSPVPSHHLFLAYRDGFLLVETSRNTSKLITRRRLFHSSSNQRFSGQCLLSGSTPSAIEADLTQKHKTPRPSESDVTKRPGGHLTFACSASQRDFLRPTVLSEPSERLSLAVGGSGFPPAITIKAHLPLLSWYTASRQSDFPVLGDVMCHNALVARTPQKRRRLTFTYSTLICFTLAADGRLARS